MNRLPKNPSPFSGLTECFVAGGAILSAVTKTEPADYDIYPKSRKAAIDNIFYLMDEESCFILNISDRAVTLKSNIAKNTLDERVIVQVMMFDEFKTSDQIFEFFDFTVCMGAWDCDSKEYIFHPDFFVDVASKTLRFNPKTRYPLNSMMRIGKYRAKGFVLPSSEMIRMSLTLMQSKLPTSWEELESVIGGTYGRQAKLYMVEDVEFSIEAAIQLFDELDISVMQIGNIEDDYSRFKAEDFANVFDGDTKWYRYTLKQEGSGDILMATKSQKGDVILINEYGYILSDSRNALELAEIFGVEFEEWNAETPLYGYKTFKKLQDGSLQNSVYSSKKITYNIGQWAEEQSSPHIFVHTVEPMNHYSQTGVYKVEYFANDIVTVGKDITVKKVRVVEKVKKTS